MAIPTTLVPQLPQVLAEADDAAVGIWPQQQVGNIRAFFGTDLGETTAPLLPVGWEGWAHPQGIVYYFHAHDRVLTHVDPRLPESLEQLQLALRKIEALLSPGWRERNIHIVLSFTREDLRKRLVQYYLVDYSTQLVFWVHPVDLRNIGLQPSQNMACLKSMLLSPFWTHVHNFSAITLGLDMEIEIQLLKNRLNRGRVPGYDHMTPWSNDDCALFLETLEAPMTGPLHYQITILGRLNAILTRHLHSLRWDMNYIERPFYPRRGFNGPVVRVFRRRGDAIERLRFPSLNSLLVSFLLFSVYIAFEGLLIFWKSSADTLAFFLIAASSLVSLFLNTSNHLGRRLLAASIHRPWFSFCLALLASFDLGLYGLFVCSGMRLLVDNSPDLIHDLTGQVVLILLLPPMLIIFILILDSRFPLHPV